MNIYQCQAKAKKEGFDSMEFVGVFKAGLLNCKWLDAYMGLFQVNHPKLKGKLLMVDQFPDLECVPLEGPTDCFD